MSNTNPNRHTQRSSARLADLAREAGELKGVQAIIVSAPKAHGTKGAMWRVGAKLIARIAATARTHGVERGQLSAFVAFLLTDALNRLDAGELTLPRSERVTLPPTED